MGTKINLSISHPMAAELLEKAKHMLADYEIRFSANHSKSTLTYVNQQAGIQPVSVDSELYDLIQFGQNYSLSSKLALNITIGPLVKLWKIGFADAHVPKQKEIDERLKLIDPTDIVLDDAKKTVYLTKKGMELDLGALAKGYFADKLKQFFQSEGVESGIVDLGGNVLTIGENPKYEDGYWRVGIQKPSLTRGELVGAVLVKDKSVVTSGIYERSLKVSEKKYHHIFDSTTGYPIENELASITIISDESLDGELWTTWLFGHNSNAAIDYIDSVPGIEALLITKNNEVKMSHGILPYVVLF
ncbi:putative thiamine biosynthesis lipoprotein [Carnobacterium sp. AT7]|uniref:FAD:protein FMN transferase n=2 Tax=Carnobacteriaceae TaxID=186828 RepID=UPI00015F1B62|nr:FAD:protein FMN transferase [Carnobacterium sp. AT7]EDP68705.1 putative thiamine biosynthesis lipoprotein [Carnobacterium sp. AT7]